MSKLFARIFVKSLGKFYTILENLLNIEFSAQDRSSAQSPSWGIKSNSGTLEMYDADGNIEYLIRQGLLRDSTINIYFENNHRQEQLGQFYIIDAIKDNLSHKVKIEFKDGLESWQQKPMPKYSDSYEKDVFLGDLLESIASSAGVTLLYETPNVREFLKTSYKVNFPHINEGSLWAQITKICEASCCYIYCNATGIPTIHYGGGT